MLVRDSYGVIVQHNRDFPEYTDAGDSLSRTALMAMCESERDHEMLYTFVIQDENFKVKGLARHPKDPKWSDVNLTSRDQIICLCGVRYMTPRLKDTLAQYAYKGSVNKDILLPHHRLVILESCFLKAGFVNNVIGRIYLFFHILYNSWIVPSSEQNQTIAMLAAMPHWWLKLFCKLHPDIRANLREYWNGYPWRDQPELSDAIIKWLEREKYL